MAQLFRAPLDLVVSTKQTIINLCFSRCLSPVQAKLFRIFQEVLNAPLTKHAEELRKLAIYMVRQFVAAAEKNQKIYAELFFWKTIRECNDLENGYETQQGGGGKAWSESQEDELRRLFQENQENPVNDQGRSCSMLITNHVGQRVQFHFN